MLTENRDTKEREGVFRRFPVLAAEIMYAGGLAAVLKSTGEAEMASDKAGLVVVGRVEQYVDNTNDGEQVKAKAGIFKLDNSSAHPVTAALIGQDCYVEDDQTVSASGGTNAIVAGQVFDVDADGVYVEVGFAEPLAAAVAALTDNSGGAASSTLAAVTNTETLGGSLTGTLDNTLADVGNTTTIDGSAAINKNFKEIQAELATQRAANTALTNAAASLAAKLNALLASLKAAGVIA